MDHRGGHRVNSSTTLALIAILVVLSATRTVAQSAGSQYVPGPEDVLEVSVWGYADLNRTVTVPPDGMIGLPLIGTVRASGLSLERLTAVLTRAYASYIVNPRVTVIVRDFRKIRVAVLGHVARPGTYTLLPGARLLELISAAGDLTEAAALKGAQLLRPGQSPMLVDLERVLAGDQEANVLLQGGETLMVPEDVGNLVSVVGEVARPGRYRLKGEMRLLDALLLAGGLTEKASMTDARLARGRDVISLDLQNLLVRQNMARNISLERGDVILVPPDRVERYYVLGDVNRPGVFDFKGEVTLLQVLAMAGGPVHRSLATAKTVHVVRRSGKTLVATVGKVEPLPGGGVLITAELQDVLSGGPASSLAIEAGDAVVVAQSGLNGLQWVLGILLGVVSLAR